MSRVRDERGAAIVEIAFVFPVLLLVLCGSMSILWLLAARSDVAEAARNVARYAAIEKDPFCTSPCYPTQADLDSRLADEALLFGIGDCRAKATDPAVQRNPSTTGRGNEQVSVGVECKVASVFAVMGLIGVDTVHASASVDKRAE